MSVRLRIGTLIVTAAVVAACARGYDPNSDTGAWGDTGTGTDGTTNDIPTQDVPPMCTGGCTLPHATAMCVAGMCRISSCDPGYADLDHVTANGCECMVGMNGNTCATAGEPGAIAMGSMNMVTGVVSMPGSDQWIHVSFAPGGHPHVLLMVNPGMALHFDVQTGCTASTAMTCMDRPMGATGLTEWEFFDAPPDGGPPPDAAEITRMTPAPTGAYVRVFASMPVMGCSPYTLEISN